MGRIWLVIAGLVFACALLAPNASASWRQFRHGAARNGYAASEITASNASTLAIRWTRRPVRRPTSTPPPPLSITTSSSQAAAWASARCRYAIQALSTSDGSVLRTFRPSGQRVFSSVAVGSRAIYASRQDGLLYKIALP
jgi:hypothetical protein